MNPLAWLLAHADDPAEATHAVEMRAEFEHHIACVRAELERAGLTPAAAAAEAERRFGARARVEAECLHIRKGALNMVNKWHAVVTAALFMVVVGLSIALQRSRAGAEVAVARALGERDRAEAASLQDTAVESWAGPFTCLFAGDMANDMRLDRADPSSPLGRALIDAAERPEAPIAIGDRLVLLDIGGRKREVGWVDEQGKLSVNELGPVPVAGLTRAEVERRLTELLQPHLAGIDLEVLINPGLEGVDLLPDDQARVDGVSWRRGMPVRQIQFGAF